jgi:translation initiation factor 2 subunit 1
MVRFYRQKYPDIGEIVMVEISKITQTGVYAKLLEYDDIVGLITINELSKRRIRSIHQYVRLEKKCCAAVFRVDEEKGYLDLSLRIVTMEDRRTCEERWRISKQINTIFRAVADNLDIHISRLYEDVLWDLYEEEGENALEVLALALGNYKQFCQKWKIPKSIIEELEKALQHHFTIFPVYIVKRIELTCFTCNGIDAIKAAVEDALIEHDPDKNIRVLVENIPIYRVCITDDIKVGPQKINNVCSSIKNNLLKSGGDYYSRGFTDINIHDPDIDEQGMNVKNNINTKHEYTTRISTIM